MSKDLQISKMIREIKFRAWDGKKMFVPAVIGSNGEVFETGRDYEDYTYFESTILMQYTGLKDKNKTEIYEGDILQIDNTDDVDMWCRGEKGLVDYKPARFSFLFMQGKERKTINADFESCSTVIGDIYRNPELLKP